MCHWLQRGYLVETRQAYAWVMYDIPEYIKYTKGDFNGTYCLAP